MLIRLMLLARLLLPLKPSKLKQRLAMLTTTTALLGGCATGHSSAGCPPLVAYTHDQEQAAFAEYQAKTAPTLNKFADDYGKLRAECRAIVR